MAYYKYAGCSCIIPNMKMFRLDRDIANGRIRGGGACLYINKKFAPFTEIYRAGTATTRDFEIISITISKPGQKR